MKEQEARGLLINLASKPLLSKIPLVDPLCFRGINKLIQDIK